jgi:PIN domain nuclease of toxin-antitoxin system
VLDSYAILAFLCQERGYAVIRSLFERAAQARRTLFVGAPNWAEVRYRMEQKLGNPGWRQAQDMLVGFPVEIVPADRMLAEMAGAMKVGRKMSLADCFAAALAKQRKADLYTGDPDFKAVETEVRVVWL